MNQFLLISLTLLISSNLYADETVTNLEKQIITASTISIPKLKGEEFYHLDFAGKYQNLSDFLQLNAGVQIRGSGIGNLVTLSIRGSSHQQIKFIVDGHMINDAQYGGFDINKLPLQQINKIEVIKSNSDSVGGTIIIDTINTHEANNSKVFGSIGSFDTYEYGFTQYLSGFGQAAISFNRLTSKADYDFPVPSPFLEPSNPGIIEPLINNKYDKNSAILKWKYDRKNKENIGLKLQYVESTKNLPNYQQNRLDNTAYLNDKETVIQGHYNFHINNKLTNKVTVNHTNKDEIFSDPQSFIGVGAFLNEYKSEITGFGESIHYHSKNYNLSSSYNLRSESFQDNHLLVSDSVKCINSTSTCDIKSEQTSSTIKFIGDWTNTTHDHKADLGIKILNLKKQQESLFSSPNKISKSNSYYNWSSAYNYYGLNDASIRIGISKAIRTPTLYELFGNRGLVKSNINLKPESSYNLNISINNTYSFFTLENDLYFRRLSDAIVAQFSGGTGSFKNLSSARILGLESKVSGYFNKIKLSINLTTQESLARSEINGFNKKKLAGIFHQSISANISYSPTNTYEIIYQFQDDQGLYVDTANLDKHDGRTTHNIKLNYLLENVSATISIENILDDRYKDQQNRPAPGIILNSTVQYTF